MPFPFVTGQRYTRRDVYHVIGLSPTPKGGNWETGYASHGADFFVFCNIGIPGRTGHDYANRWDGDTLIWYAKSGTHIYQPSIQRLTDGVRDVYLFWREDNTDSFRFAGLATPISVDATTPVRVRWAFR